MHRNSQVKAHSVSHFFFSSSISPEAAADEYHTISMKYAAAIAEEMIMLRIGRRERTLALQFTETVLFNCNFNFGFRASANLLHWSPSPMISYHYSLSPLSVLTADQSDVFCRVVGELLIVLPPIFLHIRICISLLLFLFVCNNWEMATIAYLCLHITTNFCLLMKW